jgi:hypothetical protein
MTLHTWSESGPSSAADDHNRRTRALGFILIAGEGQPSRTAMVDLEPGESATLVEAMPIQPRRRDHRARQSVRIQREDKVIQLTETDLQQRICVDY